MSDTPREQPDPVKLTDPDGNEVTIGGKSTTDQQAGIAAAQATWQRRMQLAGFVADFQDAIDALLANNWDWLDAYSDRIWPGQNGTPGAEWPQMPADPNPTTLAQAIGWVNNKVAVITDRQEIIRTQLSFMSFAQTREAQAFRLIIAVLRELIIRDPSLTPPSN